jgi:ribonuclease HII
MPDLALENACEGSVIGIDEAGRGPWAGPVTVTALWLNPHHYNQIPGDVDDSKKIKPERRAALATYLAAPPHLHCTISSDVKIIDQLGILKATLVAMAAAVTSLIADLRKAGFAGPCHALVDGNIVPPDMPCPSTAVVRGDARSLSIAGASLIAKHSRDALMHELDSQWPAYGWATNKGYGTRQHQQALAAHGVSPQHRRSFAPIRRLLETVPPHHDKY